MTRPCLLLWLMGGCGYPSESSQVNVIEVGCSEGANAGAAVGQADGA